MQMSTEEIISQVNGIFKEVLDNEEISLNYQTTAEDVEDWDSLNHIILVVAIEKHFNTRFTSDEIHNFKNVGEMCDAIKNKLSHA
jgi:acyl carrier protein